MMIQNHSENAKDFTKYDLFSKMQANPIENNKNLTYNNEALKDKVGFLLIKEEKIIKTQNTKI